MNLQGRNLSLQMTGADIKLLQSELGRRGYVISAQESDKAVFGEETRRAVFELQQARGLPATGVVDESTAKAIGNAFVVQGTVRGKDQQPLAKAVVRAFDKDLREEQSLGEATTDAKGAYRIIYGREQFRRAEKRSADLVVRVFDPTYVERLVVESEVVFNAATMQTVDLTAVRAALSEYEQYLAAMAPVLRQVAVAELAEKDIAFVSGETSIPVARVRWLVSAHGLAGRTKLPAAVFYGLARMKLPTDLAELLDRDSAAIRAALETAIERGIVPEALKKDLDPIMQQLGRLGQKDPAVADRRQKTKLHALGKLAALDDKKLEPVLKRTTGPGALDDAILAAAIKDGELKEDEARKLGLAVSLCGLLDQNEKLVQAILKAKHPKLPKSKLSHVRDLSVLDSTDWAAVLTQAGAELPEGASLEAYAALLTRRMESVYPSRALWARMQATASDDLPQALDSLKPLFERNDVVLGAASFERLKTDELAPEALVQMRATYTRLKRLANTYPGLGIAEILDDRQASSAEKHEQVATRTALLDRFQAQNPGVEVLALRFGPDSTDVQALNLSGFSAAEQRMVLTTLKAMKRAHAITGDASDAKLLLETGHHSPLVVANKSLASFIASTGLDATTALKYYDRSRGEAADAVIGLGAVVDAQMGGLGWTRVDNTGTSVGDYLKQIDGWDALFGSLDYCDCRHCRSILGPSAYFVDLMTYVEKHVLADAFRGREEHPLNLKVRRPDLWQLPLDCENTDTIIPYLDIVNEILENHVAVAAGLLARAALPPPGAVDRATVETPVYRTLLHSVHSFSQPFCLPLERLSTYLVHFEVTRGAVAALLEKPKAAIAAATLGLSRYGEHTPIPGDAKRREYELVTRSHHETTFLREVYGLDFSTTGSYLSYRDGDDETTRDDAQLLLKSMGIDRKALGEIIATKYLVTGHGDEGGSITPVAVVGEKRIPTGDEASVQNDIERVHHLTDYALDRMHRFTRLSRRLPWTTAELDLVLDRLAQSGLSRGIDGAALQHIVTIRSLEQRFHLGVEETCGLWSDLLEGENTLFGKLFNPPDFVRASDRFPSDAVFVHPAFGEVPAGTVEIANALPRLLGALRIDDQTLYQLITGLAIPLGLDLASSDALDQAFELSVANLSLLYRHAKLAQALGLSPPELFQLIRLTKAASPEMATATRVAGLTDLPPLLAFHDWWKSSGWTLDDLDYIRRDSTRDPTAYLDPATTTARLLARLQATSALTFNHAVFAFFEGVTEEQSQAIVAANLAILDKAQGLRYRTAGTIDPAAPVNLPESLPGSADERNALAADLRTLLGTYQAPNAVFDEDLFTGLDYAVDGSPRRLTLEESRAIIMANPALIAPIPLENTYRLNPTFTLTAPLTLPAGIPVTADRVRGLLSTYHAAEVIPSSLAAELGMPIPKVKALIALAAIDLYDPRYTRALRDNDPEGDLRGLVQALAPSTILFKHETFDDAALRFVSEHAGLFGFATAAISLACCRLLRLYRDLLELQGGDESRRDDLSQVLLAFDPSTHDFYTGGTSTVVAASLARMLDADVSLVRTLHDEISLPDRALEALDKIRRCLALAKLLGVGGDVLDLIASDDYDDLRKAADAILCAFRAKYQDEEDWRDKIEPFEAIIRSRRRDALAGHLLHSIAPAVFDSPDDLYHYFLVDVQLEGCARTSRVVAATGSVQLYVHRVLMNLEQNRDEDIRITLPADAAEEWEWRQNYRVWEANRKIFLYPENYLEPDLRDDKTPLFEELEATLLQQEVDESSALDAYAKYLRGLDELAKLKIAGAYHHVVDGADTLHLFGVTSSDPPVYYYRTIENLYWSELWKTKATDGVVWNPWRRIEVPIPVRKVSPIVFNNRLYAFWTEITTRPENDLVGGSSKFAGYAHTVRLKYTTLRLDGTWTPAQQVSVDGPAPFTSGNGAVHDRLETREYPPGWTEHFWDYMQDLSGGSRPDPASPGGGTTGNGRDLVLSRFDTNLRTQYQAPHYDPRTYIWPFSHSQPQDGYTLEGPRWERVYPVLGYRTTESPAVLEPCLIIEGAGSELRASLDLYRNRLSSQDSATAVLLSRSLQVADGKLYYKYIDKNFGYEMATRLLLGDVDPSSELVRYRLGPIADLPAGAEPAVVNSSLRLDDGIIDCAGDQLLVLGSLTRLAPYIVLRLGTTLGDTLGQILFTRGIDGLLDTVTQSNLVEAPLPLGALSNIDTGAFNAGKLDFQGPYGVYYREVLFHVPFLIANHLNSQGRFEEAQKWYHYIFDPTAQPTGTEACSEDRNWRYLEFRGLGVESLRDILQGAQARATYRKDPFSPHAIARLRLGAYQKAVVMKYVDNLLDWGDSLFAQDTMESINEATLLYVLASDILGERPAEIGECDEIGASTYEQIASAADEDSEFLLEMVDSTTGESSQALENQNQYVLSADTWRVAWQKHAGLGGWPASAGRKRAGASASPADAGRATDTAASPSVSASGTETQLLFRGTGWKNAAEESWNITYVSAFLVSLGSQMASLFCVPPNRDLHAYWERVADRLFKIRNCMNISGVRRDLALFAPEIDPMLLVRAKAAGLSLEDVLGSISGNVPPYRFAYLIERAKAYAGMLQGFGAGLLSALEKKDAEELNLLRLTHQQNLLKMTSQIRQDEYEAAEETIRSLELRRATVEARRSFYQGRYDAGRSDQESKQQNARLAAQLFEELSEMGNMVAALGYLVPEIGSFFALTYGGKQIGGAGDMFAQWLRSGAAIANTISASAGLEAGFQRREEEWQQQADQASRELTEIDKQKQIAEIRRDIALEQRDIHDETIKQQTEIYETYRDRFSNLGLYTWLAASLQRLYRGAYNNAYGMARLAERAYRFERGDDAAELVGSHHWEAGKAGLLAGERLSLDLQNLERRFIETNYRSLEIDQSFSLTQIAPAALVQLKQTGECEFMVPEIFFNLFYPGQYRRKIKAARLTIPCVTGPYTNVAATLTLAASQIRREPKLDQPDHSYLLDVPRSRTVLMATSTAQNDAGVFEMSFHDERYMPFEGAGAVNSRWQLSLPRTFRPFDYQTINDVILHLAYTAEYDGALRDAVEEQNAEIEGTLNRLLTARPFRRVFSFRQDFSAELGRLMRSPAGTGVRMTITDKHFPIFLKQHNLEVTDAVLVLATPKWRSTDGPLEDQSVAGFSLSIDAAGAVVDGFTRSGSEWGGLPFKAVDASAFSGGILGEHTITLVSAGDLSPAALAPSDTSAIDANRLTDIYLSVSYGLRGA